MSALRTIAYILIIGIFILSYAMIRIGLENDDPDLTNWGVRGLSAVSVLIISLSIRGAIRRKQTAKKKLGTISTNKKIDSNSNSEK